MNDQRRRALRNANKALRLGTREALDEAKDTITSIAEDEEDSRASMPESLEGTDRYCDSEDASEAMDEALSYLDEAESYFDDDEPDSAKKEMLNAVEALCNIVGVT